MAVNFRGGSFKSASCDAIEAKITNDVLAAKFMNTNTFIEFMDCIDGWWVGGYMDYNIKADGDDILVSKVIDIGLNPVLYERV